MSLAINTTAALSGSDIGLSFGGAGFLIFYYLGIVDVLNKLGVVTGSTKLAGCSSGAIISTTHCAGLSTADVYKAGQNLAHACRANMACSGTLDHHLREVLETYLPQDAYQRCQGKGFIAITTGRIMLNDHHPLLVSQFTDNSDLISAAASSSFIPLWSGGKLMQQFRGLPVYDGGFAASQPCPPGVRKCVKISTSNPTWPKRSSVETFMARLAFRGPQAIMRPDPTVRTWPAIVPSGPDAEVLKLAASKGVDIAPGIFHKVPFSQQEWNEWALTPPDDGTLKFIFELGKADAAAWAKHSGYVQATVTASKAETGGRKLLAAGSAAQ